MNKKYERQESTKEVIQFESYPYSYTKIRIQNLIIISFMDSSHANQLWLLD